MFKNITHFQVEIQSKLKVGDNVDTHDTFKIDIHNNMSL